MVKILFILLLFLAGCSVPEKITEKKEKEEKKATSLEKLQKVKDVTLEQ